MSENTRPDFTFKPSSEAAFRVYAFSDTEEVQRPSEFETELVHEASNPDFSELRGQTACLSVSDKSGGIRHVQGETRHFCQLHTANTRTHNHCSLVPRMWFLSLASDQRIFQKKNVLQFIGEKVYVKRDWEKHSLHDQHRTVENFLYPLVKGEDQQTVNLDRKVELLSGDLLIFDLACALDESVIKECPVLQESENA